MPSREADRAELVRALGYLMEAPTPARDSLWTMFGVEDPPSPADHTELFAMQLVPYASVYMGEEGMIGGDAHERVAGFWRAVGRFPPPEPDHLGHLLGLLAELLDPETGSAGAVMHEHAAQALVDEHLAPWLGPFLLRIGDIGSAAYGVWSELLGDVIDSIAGPPPARFDGSSPGVEASDDLVRFLLAPARSGLIVTRSDLARCARELGLSLRMGERAYALEALLAQDRSAVFAWMADFAKSWCDRLEKFSAWGWPHRAAEMQATLQAG